MELLKNQWLAFLERNNQIEKNNQYLSQRGEELIDIPLLPLKIDLKSFNILWNEFITLFLGQNANSLEIIIEENNQISAIYLHKVNSLNIYTQLQPIDKKTNSMPDFDLKIIDRTFDICKPWIKQQFNIEIGNIHRMTVKFLQKISEIYSKYTSGLSSGDLLAAMGEYCDLLIEAQKTGDFTCFPPSKILDFFSRLNNFLGGGSFQKFTEFLKIHLPAFEITLSLWKNPQYIPFKLNNKKSFFKVDYQIINFNPTPNLEISEQHTAYLRELSQKTKTSFNVVLDLTILMKNINEIIESPIPTDVNRFQYLIQQILFGFRNFGVDWNLYPKPALFKTGPRFLIYTSGMRLNLQKLSYWSIPKLFEILTTKVFGNHSRVILVIGETWNEPNVKPVQAYLLELENCNLQEFKKLSTEKFNTFLPVQEDSNQSKKSKIYNSHDEKISEIIPINEWLTKIRGLWIDQIGFINAIVWMDYTVIENILMGIIFDINEKSLRGLKNIQKYLKIMKDPTHFTMIPGNEITKTLKKMDEKILLQKIAALITDPHEF